MESQLIDIHIAQEYTMLLIVLVAGVIERLIPPPVSANPLTLWRLLCARIRDKVMPSDDAKRQQVISGTLALIVLATPFLAIIYTLYWLADMRALLDVLILYVCLEFSQSKANTFRISKALTDGKKQLARDLLRSQVCRQTHNLSNLGIIKASIECLTLRAMYQQCCVIILYCSGGIILALTYRLAYEAHQVWNIKILHYRNFGYFSYLLTQVCQFIPTKISNILLIIVSGNLSSYTKLPIFLLSTKTWQASGYPTFSALSIALNLHIGGTVMRKNIKYKRDKCIGLNEPGLDDIKRTVNLIDRTIICLFSMTVLVIWLLNLVSV